MISQTEFAFYIQDEVFWTDWHKHSILKVNRRRSTVLSDSSVELVADGLSTPMDVRIHHSLKQPRGKARSVTHLHAVDFYCIVPIMLA